MILRTMSIGQRGRRSSRATLALAAGGKMVETYQTRRPTVAELMRMPPSTEMTVETGPLQLHLPISAFL